MKSKIKNIIFIILIAFPFFGFTNKLKLGLHGGINFSTISASNAPKEFNMEKGFLPGLLIGLSSENKLNDDIYLLLKLIIPLKDIQIIKLVSELNLILSI